MTPTRVRAKGNVSKGLAGVARPQFDNTRGDGSVSDGTPEKDETEERLERLLFGDDAGFLEGLQARSAELTTKVDPGNGEAEDSRDGDGDLETVADENVRIVPLVVQKDRGANNLFFVALLP